MSGFHDLIDEKKLARDHSGAHKHLALHHVEVVYAHLISAEEGKQKSKGKISRRRGHKVAAVGWFEFMISE
jgi:hypothetical protein